MMASGFHDLPMSGITVYTDADVLCGRGGAAQKHVGNKTYRALVNLNKQLYASCRTTEKIKISRSIVAAIREQRGRFLERDAITDTFYDIGDKKAVEKTSQALREGQPKLKQKMINAGENSTNQTAAATRTSLTEPKDAYQPPPVPQGGEQHYGRASGPNEVHWEPPEQQQRQQQHEQRYDHGRPSLNQQPVADSAMSLMSDISVSFAAMMQEEANMHATIDGSFKNAIRDISVPDHPFYHSEEEGHAPMEPPPPRPMVEARMDSFRRILMGITSPQTSSMSLASTIGGSGGGSSRRAFSEEAQTNPVEIAADIVVPPRDDPSPAGDAIHFHSRPRDAIDDLLSVGGLSKLSLMSGISESTLDTGVVNPPPGRRMVQQGTSELTLDSALYPRGSSRRMVGHRGLSTRSTAMSEVSDLGHLQELDNEDDDNLEPIRSKGFPM